MADPSTGMQYGEEGDPIDLMVFGSIARGDYHARSDLNLAVIGCTPEQFMAIEASLQMHATRFILGRSIQGFHAQERSRRWSRELQDELVQDGTTVWTNHPIGIPWEHRA